MKQQLSCFYPAELRGEYRSKKMKNQFFNVLSPKVPNLGDKINLYDNNNSLAIFRYYLSIEYFYVRFIDEGRVILRPTKHFLEKMFGEGYNEKTNSMNKSNYVHGYDIQAGYEPVLRIGDLITIELPSVNLANGEEFHHYQYFEKIHFVYEPVFHYTNDNGDGYFSTSNPTSVKYCRFKEVENKELIGVYLYEEKK